MRPYFEEPDVPSTVHGHENRRRWLSALVGLAERRASLARSSALKALAGVAAPLSSNFRNLNPGQHARAATLGATALPLAAMALPLAAALPAAGRTTSRQSSRSPLLL